MANTRNAVKSFEALGSQVFGLPTREEKKKMNANRIDSPLLDAECKYYNHDKNFGFLYVKFPQGEKTPFPLVSADKDGNPGDKFSKDEVLERPVIVECFIHGSVLTKANYRQGLDEGETLRVRLKEDQHGRGLQAFWTEPNGDSSDNTDSRKVRNERRTANAFLPFVSGTVKKYNPEKGFGFLVTTFDHETGDALPAGEENEVYFKGDVLTIANIENVNEGDTLHFKYWKYSDGRCKAAQFRFLNREEE
jgi:cold shock CspA family protein